MNNFRTFPSAQAARDYRHANGTGGWIFSPDDGGEAILFPPDMPPIARCFVFIAPAPGLPAGSITLPACVLLARPCPSAFSRGIR